MLFITWFLKKYYVHKKVVHTQKVDSFSTRLLVRGSHIILIVYVNDKNSEACGKFSLPQNRKNIRSTQWS